MKNYHWLMVPHDRENSCTTIGADEIAKPSLQSRAAPPSSSISETAIAKQNASFLKVSSTHPSSCSNSIPLLSSPFFGYHSLVVSNPPGSEPPTSHCSSILCLPHTKSLPFQSRFYSRKSFSRRRENAPTSTVKEDEKQKHDNFRLLSARKVYVIVGAQLFLTLTVSPAVMQLVPGITEEFVLMMLAVLTWPLVFHYEKYPLNVITLGPVTFCLSLMMSPALSVMQGEIIFASLALTTAIVSSFTGFVFWAAKKGYTDIWYRDPTWEPGLILFILNNEFGFPGTAFRLAIRGLNLLAWVVAQNDFEYD